MNDTRRLGISPHHPLHLALDLDGVIYDFDGYLRTLYRLHHHRQPHAAILPEQARVWNDVVDDMHWADIHQALDFYTAHDGWAHHPLIEPTPRLRRILASPELDVTILTARPAAAYPATRYTVDRDLGQHLRVIIADKPKYLYPHHHWVDDSPSEIERYIECRLDYTIYDQPWNQHLPGPRVYNLDDLCDRLQHLVQSHQLHQARILTKS